MHQFFAVCLAVTCAAPAAGGVDFSRDVQPILAANCYHCHGPDPESRKARLRLDRPNGVAEELLRRVTSGDASERMPPPHFKAKLKPAEVATLKKWVKAGAKYAKHWAFLRPTRPAVPAGDSAWARRPIDRFILQRLTEAGLTPNGDADPAVWLRRASLDLTGLPPTPAEVRAFVNDESPGAAARAADRLLASPAFGERWGRVWLDLARYADSAGYADDPPRTIWMYRDWVIDAINANKPFDRFSVEQLAGDLLPEKAIEHEIATAFHRNTMTNNEGGTDNEEFRSAAVVDRVNTTMQVWMGLTMGCAQCHTHKYDPITQEEYFRMYAVFNGTADADRRDEAPFVRRQTRGQERRAAELRSQIASLRRGVEAERATLKPPEYAGELPVRFIRVESLKKRTVLHLAEVEAFAGSENVALAGTARQVNTGYGAPAGRANDGVTDGDFDRGSVSHTRATDRPWWEVDLGRDYRIDRVVIWNRTDNGLHERLGDYRVVALDARRRPAWVKQYRQAPEPRQVIRPPVAAGEWRPADRERIVNYMRAGGFRVSPKAKRLERLKKQLAGIRGVPTPVMRELPKKRETHIHIRGNFRSKGRRVAPGVPAAFHAAPAGNMDRLALAKWLTDGDNPLTARVTANRVWEQLFGVGLVETSEDFGVQGEPPSHPELLDWLAVELAESGWDLKRLIREVVLSSAYRQSSRVTTAKLAADPKNRLVSRGPRFRLSAEVVRDQALAVSGLLSRKMRGEPVRPPQPKLGLKAAFGGPTDWQTSAGEDKYRRGLYTSWRRSTPYPSMAAFDAPTRQVCTVRRIRTNTPLQALVTLNDPVYVEAAQALARRIISEGGSGIEERAAHGLRLCLAREPRPAETARLARLFRRAHDFYRRRPADAKMMATVPLGTVPAGAEVAELAAWAVVGNVLMNLDEFLARP